MQGIGSDPNYNPNASKSNSGLSEQEIAAKLAEASKQVYGFVGAVWETTSKTIQETKIQETVASTWSSLAQAATTSTAGSTSNNNNNNSYSDDYDNYSNSPNTTGSATSSKTANADPLTTGWGALSSVSYSLWSQAAAATSSFVETLVEEPKDEDVRFPRTNPNIAVKDGANNNSSNSNGSAMYSASRDSASEQPGIPPLRPVSGSGVNTLSGSNSSSALYNGSSYGSVPMKTGVPSAPRSFDGQTAANNNNNARVSPIMNQVSNESSSSWNEAAAVNKPVKQVRATSNNTTAATTSTPSPVGDDFFSAFGVK
jgi:hypothetical protein